MANASVTITGTPSAPILNFDIPQGEKGDVGGIVLGSLLGTIDLNTITVPGTYRQIDTTGANGSLVLNYPYVGFYGSVIVYGTTGSDVVQEAYQQSYNTTIDSRRFSRRAKSNGVWSPWRTFTSTRVDQTAGRAVYQWDDLNDREQLVYGDTGSRDISTLADPAKVTGQIWMRRNGYSVTINFHAVSFLASGSGAVIFIPASVLGTNYKPTQTFRAVMSTANTFETRLLEVGVDGSVGLYNPTTTAGYSGSVTFQTWNPWPTTLIGTANGAPPPNV